MTPRASERVHARRDRPVARVLDRAGAVGRLTWFFRRNGCVRRPNLERRQTENQRYKKGYEVRLLARDQGELELICRCLRLVHLRHGRPYDKRGWKLVPLYGKRCLAAFQALLVRAEAAGPEALGGNHG